MKDDLLYTIGDNIKRFMIIRGFNTEESFAIEAELDKGHLNKIIRGLRMPQVSTLVKIAVALNVSLDALCSASTLAESNQTEYITYSGSCPTCGQSLKSSGNWD